MSETIPTIDAGGRFTTGGSDAFAAAPPDTTRPDTPDTEPATLLLEIAPLRNTVLLRHPGATRSAEERLLVEAHERGRRRAVDELAQWFPDFDVEALARVELDEPTVLAVEPTRLASLDLMATLDRLLTTHDMAPPKLVLASDGQHEHQPPPDVAVTPPRGAHDHHHARLGPIGALVGGGTTVIVHAAHENDPRLAAITEALGFALCTQSGVNLYLSRADAVGFGPHWDDHDVLIVPAVGAKTWRLHRPTAPAALRPVVGPEVTSDVAMEVTLEPGMALFVPRGWGHEVTGDEGLSLHATFTMQRLLGLQLVEFLAGMSGFWPLFRADVPADLDQPVQSYAGSVYDQPAAFANAARAMASPEALAHGEAQWRAKLPGRSVGSLTATLAAFHDDDWAGVTVRASFPGGLMLVDEKADPELVARALSGDEAEVTPTDAVILAAQGNFLRLPRWLVPTLAHLAASVPVRVADLPFAPPPEVDLDVGAVMARFASVGLIDIVDGDA